MNDLLTLVRRGALAAALALSAVPAVAQKAPPNGPRKVDPRWHALVHATLVPRPGQRVADATVVMRHGRIVRVEPAGEPPDGARVWDCTGLTVHAGFLDAHLPVAVPRPEPEAPGAHWNPEVMAQRSVLAGTGPDEKTAEQLRGMGFTAAALAPADGILRGTAAVVLLDRRGESEGIPPVSVVAERVYHGVAFDRSRSGYPRSTMGCIALVRQTLLDADWYRRAWEVHRRSPGAHEAPKVDHALAALAAAEGRQPPLLAVVRDELEALAARRLGRELGRRTIVLGSGTEFRRLAALAEDAAPLVLPLAFPKAPEVATVPEAETVSLRELMTWEQAPTNPRRVAAAGIRAALTTDKLEKRGDFLKNLRRAIRHGLAEHQALAMLTVHPAEILGVGDRLGAVAPGMIANLVVTEGPLFEEKRIRSVWIRGRRHVIRSEPPEGLDGSWHVAAGELLAGHEGALEIRAAKKKVALVADADRLRAREVRVGEHGLHFLLDGPEGNEGVHMVRAVLAAGKLLGTTRTPDGEERRWTAERAGAATAGEDEEVAEEVADVPERIPTPFGAFGRFAPPEGRDLLITGATVWTCGPPGVLRDAAVAIVGGKIAYVGPADGAPRRPGARVIEARGKHVTPGLIDCHSHTGIHGGVNEGTQAVTSEVRIGDVVDPDDIGWYRQLAGGLTAANQLHGSANPIGGQNHVVKLRWGVPRPRAMRLRGATAGIKFALGENVKRSRSRRPSSSPSRYPQSRMGVEAIIRDRLIAAREYLERRRRHAALPPGERQRAMPPRRDLELEALGEILTGERLVHCHSYRQDEILMLCRVARDFGFRIGTFQHGLECYKVADAVGEAARGASIFSDWWAYKIEVFDAIPQAGPILHRVGVKVSYNSDSSELARRLNTEAAKAVKYGAIDPHEALKFVTYNPAFQLGVEDRVGSLAAGKDGDLVIWSGDPLSSFSRCEATFVDGREYFSLEQDRALRAWAAKERSRILQKLLRRKKDRGKEHTRPESESDGIGPRAGREVPR